EGGLLRGVARPEADVLHGGHQDGLEAGAQPLLAAVQRALEQPAEVGAVGVGEADPAEAPGGAAEVLADADPALGRQGALDRALAAGEEPLDEVEGVDLALVVD